MIPLFHRIIFAHAVVLMLRGADIAHAQGRVVVQVRGRVVDAADSVPLFGVAIRSDSVSWHPPEALSDSSGRFAFQATIDAKFLKIQFSNAFYVSDSIETSLVSREGIDLGTVLLNRGPEPIEYMVIPTCKPVGRLPSKLPQGMWLQRDASSKRGAKPIVCDGLLREPRLQKMRPDVPPNTR